MIELKNEIPWFQLKSYTSIPSYRKPVSNSPCVFRQPQQNLTTRRGERSNRPGPSSGGDTPCPDSPWRWPPASPAPSRLLLPETGEPRPVATQLPTLLEKRCQRRAWAGVSCSFSPETESVSEDDPRERPSPIRKHPETTTKEDKGSGKHGLLGLIIG